jgi:Luciferase-like monooxygenase
MRHGIYLPNQGAFAEVAVLVELARAAETAGWDGFFVWDELLPLHAHNDAVRATLGDSDDVADAMVALTAVAAATERIRFGTLVTAVARLRPEGFARQAATLDRLSGGRRSYRAPRRRAARWDGFAPASEQWPLAVIPPETYAEIAADLQATRTTKPYDVVLIGNADATEPTPDTIPQYEGHGVTWLLTQALTVEDARTRISHGPPARFPR